MGGVRDQRPRQSQRGWKGWRGEVLNPWDGFCELPHEWLRLAQSTAHPWTVHTPRSGGSAAPWPGAGTGKQ